MPSSSNDNDVNEYRCVECRSEMNVLAKDRGIWYWCHGCGTLHRRFEQGTLEKVRSPGTLAALRALANTN